MVSCLAGLANVSASSRSVSSHRLQHESLVTFFSTNRAAGQEPNFFSSISAFWRHPLAAPSGLR
jgi:hypothetical protein